MNDGLVVQLIASGILFGTPILFAGLGELLGERSGILNLGIEGMMLMGAVAAVWATTFVTGSQTAVLLAAVGAAVVAATLTAALFAFAVITSRITSGSQRNSGRVAMRTFSLGSRITSPGMPS